MSYKPTGLAKYFRKNKLKTIEVDGFKAGDVVYFFYSSHRQGCQTAGYYKAVISRVIKTQHEDFENIRYVLDTKGQETEFTYDFTVDAVQIGGTKREVRDKIMNSDLYKFIDIGDSKPCASTT